MTLQDQFRVMTAGWRTILLGLLVGLLLGYCVSVLTRPQYSSSATLIVAAAGDGTAGGLAQSSDFVVQRAQTYAALVDTDLVVQPAAEDLSAAPDSLRTALSASTRTGTAVFDVYARGASGQEAADVANSAARVLAEVAPTLDPLNNGAVTVQIVSAARASADPVAPRLSNNLVIGGLLGIVAGIALVISVEALDPRVRNGRDVTNITTPRTLSLLPASPRFARVPLGVKDRRTEGFRQLRTNIQFGVESKSSVLACAVAGRNSSRDVPSQLSKSLAEVGFQVVLLDMGTSHSNDSHPISPGPGLTEYLLGTAALDTIISERHGFSQISLGLARDKTLPNLGTAAMEHLLHSLRSRFDYIVVAAPSLIGHSEVLSLAALCDHVLLTIKPAEVRQRHLSQSLQLLASVDKREVSVVLDGAR